MLALLAASGCSTRSGNPARIATGYISHVVCSYVFVCGLDPARVNDEQIAGNPVFSGFNWALSHEVDLARREVKARAVGGFESRAAYRDGLGCVNLNGTQSPDAPTRAAIEADGPIPVLLPDIAGPEMVTPTQAGLRAALDGAFAEPDGAPVRRTHAVVIVHNGRVVAERYAVSTTPTPNAFVGYGAGWWINQGDSQGARFRRDHGMPADAFMALGIYGQTVVVVPSERLVITRFGTTYDLRMAMIDTCRLTTGTIAALHAQAAGAPRPAEPR